MFRGIVSISCVLSATWAASALESGARSPAGTVDPGRVEPESGVSSGPGARPLPFFYDLYTFRGSGPWTAVVAAFAVPAGRLEKEEVDREVRYRFDVTLVLADTARRRVSRTDDSVFVGLPQPLGNEHLLYTQVQVDAPPSRTTVQRVIMTDATTPGIGQLYGSGFSIPDYSGSHLMLSDIALGKPGVASGWTRGEVTLALLPTSQFPESAFDVYYEIYNLPAGRPYATEIYVERLVREGDEQVVEDQPVRLRFSGESRARDDGTLPELRHVGATLPRGRYRITVEILDQETGRTATRSRVFEVRGWERGATLVAALPRGGRGS